MTQTADERFWTKVDRRGPDDCWRWTAYLYPNGYGQFWNGGKKVRAHRYSYESVYGPIPEGLVPDHTCHTQAAGQGLCDGGDFCPHRACVNHAHIEVVTKQVNILRGLSHAAANAAKTHCVHGHEYTPENTHLRQLPNGGVGRRCRSCSKNAKRRYRAAARATAGDGKEVQG